MKSTTLVNIVFASIMSFVGLLAVAAPKPTTSTNTQTDAQTETQVVVQLKYTRYIVNPSNNVYVTSINDVNGCQYMLTYYRSSEYHSLSHMPSCTNCIAIGIINPKVEK